MASKSALLLLASFFASSLALQVAPDSPCTPLCTEADDDKATKGDDITCNDSDYLSSRAGQKFQRCMTCLQDSGYSSGRETDQQWFLYNMRYSFDYCIFGFPNATDVGSNPCQTSTACGALEKALLYGDLNPDFDRPYSYCEADDGTSVVSDEFHKCVACVRAGGHHRYLTNYLIALEAGCEQKPPTGQKVSLNDTVFAETLIEKVDPTPVSVAEKKLKLASTTIAAITISGLVVFLLALGCIYVQYRKRTNKRNPRRGLRAGRRTVSSLSFRCRAHLTPMGGAFAMGDREDGEGYQDGNEKVVRFETVQEEYEYDEKKELQERDRLEKDEQTRQHQREEELKHAAREKPFKHPSEALSSNPIRMAPPSTHSPTNTRPNLWNPHNAIQSLEGLARSASSSSKASSTRMGRSKESLSTIKTQLPMAPPPVQQSPMTRFSPQSDFSTPTSAQSTAPLLPIKPYNPADFGTSSPSLGPVGMGMGMASPASSVGTSFGMDRRYPPASPALSVGSPMMSQGGWPLPAGAARPAQNQSSQSPAAERGYNGGYGRKPSGSPVETRTLQTNFPAPPRR